MAIDTVTNRAKKEIMDGTSPLVTATDLRSVCLKGAGVAGLTAATVQDLNFLSELDAITNVDLCTERLALTSETVTEDDTNNRANADCADFVFAADVGNSAEGLAIYKEGASDAARMLVSVHTTGFSPALPMTGGLTVAVPNGYINGN